MREAGEAFPDARFGNGAVYAGNETVLWYRYTWGRGDVSTWGRGNVSTWGMWIGVPNVWRRLMEKELLYGKSARCNAIGCASRNVRPKEHIAISCG